jgi:hypothetical protein
VAGRNFKWKNGAFAASAFGLGVVAGVFLKAVIERMQERGRDNQAHRENERTVAYPENLPDALERREPAPHAGQPRFGGTGALGFSPAAVTRPTGEPSE